MCKGWEKKAVLDHLTAERIKALRSDQLLATILSSHRIRPAAENFEPSKVSKQNSIFDHFQIQYIKSRCIFTPGSVQQRQTAWEVGHKTEAGGPPTRQVVPHSHVPPWLSVMQRTTRSRRPWIYYKAAQHDADNEGEEDSSTTSTVAHTTRTAATEGALPSTNTATSTGIIIMMIIKEEGKNQVLNWTFRKMCWK